MHLEILVEDLSGMKALEILFPKLKTLSASTPIKA
jgi:hypothetical protein